MTQTASGSFASMHFFIIIYFFLLLFGCPCCCHLRHLCVRVRACAQTLKGTGGDIIVAEEAAYMDLRVFFEVIVPLLEMEQTSLICISTILESFNFYSRLLDLSDGDGNSLFETLRFELICEACKASDAPEKCTHMLHLVPRWQSADRHKRLKLVMAGESLLLCCVLALAHVGLAAVGQLVQCLAVVVLAKKKRVAAPACVEHRRRAGHVAHGILVHEHDWCLDAGEESCITLAGMVPIVVVRVERTHTHVHCWLPRLPLRDTLVYWLRVERIGTVAESVPPGARWVCVPHNKRTQSLRDLLCRLVGCSVVSPRERVRPIV